MEEMMTAILSGMGSNMWFKIKFKIEFKILSGMGSNVWRKRWMVDMISGRRLELGLGN